MNAGEAERAAAFRIDPRDNVATALAALPPGPVAITGEPFPSGAAAIEDIPAGHKIALRPIARGEDIVKYGVAVGRATRDIAAGAWVHLHCLESKFDEKSARLDPETGTSRDTVYG